MPKYIKKKDLKNAIDKCTWYHIGKNGELVEGANSSEHEPLYKYSDIKEIIKSLPTRKFETEPKRTALSKALKWTYGDEPNSSETPNDSTISKEEFIERLKNLRMEVKQMDCRTCRHNKNKNGWYEDTPQTEMAVGNKATLTIKDGVAKVEMTDCAWK